MVRWARCAVRSFSSGLETSARVRCSASLRVAATGTASGVKNCAMAWLGAVTTGVPDAVISKIRRAHMLGESTTELTLRKTLYALYADSVWG